MSGPSWQWRPQAEVRRQAGNKPILLRVSFYSTTIGFETTFKDDSYPIASMHAHAVYNWSLNGLQRGTGSLASSSSNPDAPFGVDEVDWGLLPKIVADARTKLAMPNGRVTSINVKKPTDSVGTPVPIWSVYYRAERRARRVLCGRQGCDQDGLAAAEQAQAGQLA